MTVGTAVIYARFSCSKQREASIDDQLRVCRDWCAREGYAVVAEYCDHAVSGRTDDRPQFGLNEKGYKNKYGRPITDVMVAGIVRNEAYKGVYAFGHVRVEGGLPRIVADAEWDAAQDERRRMSVKHRRHVYVRPGMQFGHLQVVESAGTAKHHTKWLCECKACGSTKVEWATRLTSGKAQDCGCLRLCQSSGLIIIPSRSPILRKTSSHPMEFAKRQALDTRMSSLL